MYLDFYGFTEKPFAITPNPRFIFFSTIHREAFALLLYGINHRFGFMELVGEVGTGKTTVLRTLLGRLDEENYRTALIFNPSLSPVELMRAVNREYGIPAASDNPAELTGELNRFLLEENAAGRTVVLVIDEAQNLAPAVLEQVRLISNLETDTDKLIQIVLAGQPELARLLERPDLRQLNQRIALRYQLRPLDRHDAGAYLEHRLTVAGGRDRVSFTAAARWWLYRCSRGTPRIINMLCDRALLIGYTGEKRKISGRIVTLAFRDVMLKPAVPFRRLLRGVLPMLALAVLGVLVGYPHVARQRTVAAAPRLSAPTGAREATPPPPAHPAAFGRESSAQPGHALATDLPLLSETKTALQAFNALAPRWHVPTVSALNEKAPVAKTLKRLARKRNLEMTPFKGSMEELIRLDTPALLVLSAQKGNGGVLVALTGTRGGNVTIAPPLAGRTTFTAAEASAVWSGQAYLLWRNRRNVPLNMTPGMRGPNVRKLQALLLEAGCRAVQANGVYDRATVNAVRAFQASHGLRETGITAPATLIRLYRAAEVSPNGPVKGGGRP
ncbi:MAG TPA: AAA family ATPase [Geobacteraceae bacterium]